MKIKCNECDFKGEINRIIHCPKCHACWHEQLNTYTIQSNHEHSQETKPYTLAGEDEASKVKTVGKESLWDKVPDTIQDKSVNVKDMRFYKKGKKIVKGEERR